MESDNLWQRHRLTVVGVAGLGVAVELLGKWCRVEGMVGGSRTECGVWRGDQGWGGGGGVRMGPWG